MPGSPAISRATTLGCTVSLEITSELTLNLHALPALKGAQQPRYCSSVAWGAKDYGMRKESFLRWHCCALSPRAQKQEPSIITAGTLGVPLRGGGGTSQVGSDPGPEHNLARAWAHCGVNASGPTVGVIVVWRHHVGKIVGREMVNG